MMVRLLAALPTLALGATVCAASGQRFNLADERPSARFPLEDITWPAEVGQASICLWHDDRLAALSITIDDNCAPDIPWWREKADAHGFRATWFVITGRVSGPNSRQWGTWEQFQTLVDEGHAVESHTVEHLHRDKHQPDGSPWSIEWEYVGSLAHLREHLPGANSATLAYPGGANREQNNRALAAAHYRAARGGAGMPNPANRIDYFAINGMSGFNIGREDQPWANLNNIIDRSLYGGKVYRGWAVVLSHSVNDKTRPALEELFGFIDARKDLLWLGRFPDVARYGQQRDTARLTVERNDANAIVFSVTDDMDDAWFNHPLSIKVRVPDAWSGIRAEQAGRPLVARLIRRNNASYAIVQAVPDRGSVICTP